MLFCNASQFALDKPCSDEVAGQPQRSPANKPALPFSLLFLSFWLKPGVHSHELYKEEADGTWQLEATAKLLIKSDKRANETI